MAGLRSFPKKVILIAGGYDKHIPFDVLGPEITAHVQYMALCGVTADKIRAAVESAPDYAPGAPEMEQFDNLTAAIRACRAHAQPGDVVLFSPACASFDQFPNFMAGGNFFKEVVNNFN
jgi:UDP-N-acetylmuramoylalanine--D-glutamate ligase